jgi:transketolase
MLTGLANARTLTRVMELEIARAARQGVELTVVLFDVDDLTAFNAALERARRPGEKPHLIIAKTLIGKGIPEVAGTQKAHGEGGAKFSEAARVALGLPAETFYVSDEVKKYFAEHQQRLRAGYNEWLERFEAWRSANLTLAEELSQSRGYALATGSEPQTKSAQELLYFVPEFAADSKIATRKAGQDVLQPLASVVPLLIGGSADLYGSTLNYIGDLKAGNDDFKPGHRTGRNIRFGIREHGMCSILNGVAADGIFRASGATFLVFADYCRASIRLAALSHLPVIYVFTHDSIGVGEDGPTHQPVETIPGLRVIPNLDLIRPADPEETAAAFAAALERMDGPTLIALSRQAVPLLSSIPLATRREGTLRGGYIAKRESAPLQRILLSAGSELQHALAAAETLGAGTRVVSLPCFARFDRQPPAYREEVLPSSCRRRISIEASTTATWAKYVGLDGISIGIDHFGMSGPGGEVMKELGMTAAHVLEAARKLES